MTSGKLQAAGSRWCHGLSETCRQSKCAHGTRKGFPTAYGLLPRKDERFKIKDEGKFVVRCWLPTFVETPAGKFVVRESDPRITNNEQLTTTLPTLVSPKTMGVSLVTMVVTRMTTLIPTMTTLIPRMTMPVSTMTMLVSPMTTPIPRMTMLVSPMTTLIPRMTMLVPRVTMRTSPNK